MATATYNKFQNFPGDVGLKKIDLNTDELSIYLSNATPSASADVKKADLAEIAGGNGYTTGGYDTTNLYSEASGTGTLTGTSFDIEASDGAIAQFRYLVLFDETATDDPLIAWWDYGAAVDLTDGQKLTVTIGANILTIT